MRVSRMPDPLTTQSTRHDARGASDRYRAFISYSHKDSATAEWLHEALERFRVPLSLVGRETANGPVPRRLAPVFRDRQELAASGDLGETIRQALSASTCLIVLCSPEAATSRWTNEEILAFKKLRPAGCILAVIVDGEPFASDLPKRASEECFPPALRHKFDSRGRPTARRAEPIAADLRPHGDGRQLGLLKVIAGMLGVALDDLVQRDQQRRHKRLTLIAAASLAGMVLTSGLAIFAFDKRDEARDQRSAAEGLVGFMLGDLREKLEPIGRLDALDSVGRRALDYYANQDKSDLSDEALIQQSKALTLIGEIANARGDFDGAMARYQQAMMGTAEMVRRHPDDPQTLFDHAQNVFWVSDIAVKRGDTVRAEAETREYRRLAYRMKALEPDNPKWLLETKYADNNLGVMLTVQRRYAEAIRQLSAALATAEALAAAQPGNTDYQVAVTETLAWLSEANYGAGQFEEAIAKRERQVQLLESLAERFPADVDYRGRLVPARRTLGRWLVSSGEDSEGTALVQSAVANSEALVRTEPDNADWLGYSSAAHLDAARVMLALRSGDPSAQLRAGCDQARQLVARNPKSSNGHQLLLDCYRQRAVQATGSGAGDEAAALARRAVAAARDNPGKETSDARIALGMALKLLGDTQSRAGEADAARRSWEQALRLLGGRTTLKPDETASLAALYRSLGRRAEAKALDDRLSAMGYRRPL